MEWRSERLKNLKAPDGWLNLAGLYWLDSGKNEKKTMEIPNVLGGTNKVESPGVLKFEYRGETVYPPSDRQQGEPFSGIRRRNQCGRDLRGRQVPRGRITR